MPCYDLLRLFQTGRSHMAVLVRPPEQPMAATASSGYRDSFTSDTGQVHHGFAEVSAVRCLAALQLALTPHATVHHPVCISDEQADRLRLSAIGSSAWKRRKVLGVSGQYRMNVRNKLAVELTSTCQHKRSSQLAVTGQGVVVLTCTQS